ncbi:unnamed protein product [Mytilus coruscus]|uniref:Ig-like domain-containing protein n=1 Tax=Mytilus coruscus TaxID=42192 RepID=A0A6J7ZUL2_MYTCO|nr:unnamed protein product [Mytilus coruscus]
MDILRLLLLFITAAKGYGSEINWQLLTKPVYFGQDVLMSCFRPYFKGEMYLAWLNKTADYIARENISSNETKYEVKLNYTEVGILYTLTIKSFDSDDVNTTYKCYMGFESYLANLVEMNTTFLYPPRSEDITFIDRSEKNELIQVAIWKAYPKPACHIFVGLNGFVVNDMMCHRGTILMILISVSILRSEGKFKTTLFVLPTNPNILENNSNLQHISIYEEIQSIQSQIYRDDTDNENGHVDTSGSDTSFERPYLEL